MSESDAHERWVNDAAAYALNALEEEEEVARFELHLAGCPRCQEKLGLMRAAVRALPAAAPAHAAPSDLKQRVMDAIHADSAEQALATSKPVTHQRRGRPIAIRPRWALSGLAAAVAAAAVIALSLAGGSPVRTYAGVTYAPGASASVRVIGGHARLVFARLPTLPSKLIYEMWLQRGNAKPVPAGAVFATTSGAVTVPGGVRGVQAVLVTAEPRPSGTQIPTRAPIIVVRLA